MRPLLTIIIPGCAKTEHLEAAVKAVKNQSFDDFELLIVNDCITERPIRLAWNDRKLRVFATKEKKSSTEAFNFGLHHARGEYSLFFSPANWILPGLFAESIEHLLNHPKASLCISDEGYFYENEEILRSKKVLPDVEDPFHFDAHETLHLFKKGSDGFAPHTAIFKTRCVEQCGGFHAHLGPLSEWFLLHKMALKYGVVYLPKTLAAKRVMSECQKTRRKSYLSLLKHLSKERELRWRFAQSSLLHPMVRMHMPKLLLNPREWDLVLPLLQKRFMPK